MSDNQRTAVVVGLSLVGLPVFTGLLFVLYVLTEGGPDGPPPEPAPEPVEARPASIRGVLDRHAAASPGSLWEVAGDLVGDNGVRCRIAPDVPSGTATLALADDPRGWLGLAAVRRDVVVLTDIPADGEGTLTIEGRGTGPVAWTNARDGGGRCSPDPLVLGD